MMNRRLLKIGIWTAGSILGAVLFFYALEDWRGAHAWNEVRKKVAANGLTLDLRELSLPPVPEAENFCSIPLLKGIELGSSATSELTIDERDRKRERLMQVTLLSEGERPPVGSGADTGKLRDLTGWKVLLDPDSELSAAQLILREMEARHGDIFAQLVEGAARPYARFPSSVRDELGYEEMLGWELPHLSPMMRLSQALSLRASAALQVGESQVALESVQIQLRLIEASLAEPYLIGNSVAFTMSALLLPVIWEGLAREAWGPEELAQLEGALDKIDLVENLGRVANANLCFWIAGMDFLKTAEGREFVREYNAQAEETEEFSTFYRWLPNGWLDQNKAFLANDMLEQVILPASQLNYKGLTQVQNLDRSQRPRMLAPCLAVPDIDGVAGNTLRIQVRMDLAAVACALERHRAEQGDYPADLAAIGRDVTDRLGDGSFIYQRVPGGRFLLYSLGANQQDDGGTVVYRAEKKRRIDSDQGDWVWEYPIAQED